jgi:hypothetical protein
MLSQRTRDALAAAKANGKQLGSLHAHGREAKAAAIERARALAPLFDELADNSPRDRAYPERPQRRHTPTGKPWSAMTVNRARDRLAAA